MEPDQHDGTYELMRKTVDFILKLEADETDWNDLQLLVFMSVGTWKYSIAKKRELIAKSNLHDQDKKSLNKIIDEVIQNTKKGMYQNTTDPNHFGMFGTGTYTLIKPKKGMTTRVISKTANIVFNILNEIIKLNNSDKIFDIAEKYLSKKLDGLGAGMLSQILHYIKPDIFPVLNSQGIKTYKALGLNLSYPDKTEYYIENCREIREFRDKNFKFKNYRVIDWAWFQVHQGETDDTDEELEDYLDSINYWIFQANPDKQGQWESTIFEEWIEQNNQFWPLNAHNDKVKIGDKYIFYKGGHNNGLCGWGKITSINEKRDNGDIGVKIQFLGRWKDKIIPTDYLKKEYSNIKWGIQHWTIMSIDKQTFLDILKLRDVKISKNVQEDALMQNNQSNLPLNLILYGPPGTGKTYSLPRKAVQIIENKTDEQAKDMKEDYIKQQYQKYRKNRQVEFITFHQSYSYEEFIQGIKPIMNDDNNISYSIEDGIFKKICDRARENIISSKIDSSDTYTNSYITNLITEYSQYIQDELSKNEQGIDFYGEFKLIDISINSKGEISTFKISTGNTRGQSLSVKNLKKWFKLYKDGIIKSYKDIKPTYESKKGIHGNAIYYFELLRRLGEFEKENQVDVESIEFKKFIIIIDEINRGNISKIFGELITLIEKDKRYGERSEIAVSLPYEMSDDSDDSFSVPSNLYIIGTMNTADRSIALMDTALRRRFEFREKMPDIQVIRDHNDGEPVINDIKLPEMLQAINDRIEFLYDRDHTIGHSYLMGLYDFDGLKNAMRHKIFPLLQEYFYDDWEKIKLVLNIDNDGKNDNAFIVNQTDSGYLKNIPKDNDYYNPDKKVYRINEEGFSNPQNYKRIYGE